MNTALTQLLLASLLSGKLPIAYKAARYTVTSNLIVCLYAVSTARSECIAPVEPPANDTVFQGGITFILPYRIRCTGHVLSWHGHAFSIFDKTAVRTLFTVTVQRFNGTSFNSVSQTNIINRSPENGTWTTFNERVDNLSVECGDRIVVRVRDSCNTDGVCPFIPVVMTSESTNSAITYRPSPSAVRSQRTDIRVLLSATINTTQQGMYSI